MRYWQELLPKDGSVDVRPLTTELTGLSIAGPQSRSLLQKLTDEDISNGALPFMTFREMDLGPVPAKIGRLTFTGDLGYEIWVPVGLSHDDFTTCSRKPGRIWSSGHFGGGH